MFSSRRPNPIDSKLDLGITEGRESPRQNPMDSKPDLGITEGRESPRQNPMDSKPDLGIPEGRESPRQNPIDSRPDLGIPDGSVSPGQEELLREFWIEMKPQMDAAMASRLKYVDHINPPELDASQLDPNKPLPKGYAWTSCVPRSGVKSFVYKMHCVHCGVTDHMTFSDDCPKKGIVDSGNV